MVSPLPPSLLPACASPSLMPPPLVPACSGEGRAKLRGRVRANACGVPEADGLSSHAQPTDHTALATRPEGCCCRTPCRCPQVRRETLLIQQDEENFPRGSRGQRPCALGGCRVSAGPCLAPESPLALTFIVEIGRLELSNSRGRPILGVRGTKNWWVWG